MRETRAAPGIPQYSPVAWTKTIAINQKEGLKEKNINVTTKEHPAAEKQQNNAARPCGAEWNFNKKRKIWNLKRKKKTKKTKLNFGKTGLHTHVDNKNHKFIWKQEKNETVTFFLSV